jgi:Protein of unknown function (DUF2783)
MTKEAEVFKPNLEDADGFYERLLDAHRGLSREQSESLNARLVLVMANLIGSSEQLARCLAAAAQE